MRHQLRAVLLSRSRRTCQSLLLVTVALSGMFVLLETSVFAQGGAANGKKQPGYNPEKIDPDALPPGFEPPPEPLAIVELEQPIATPEELASIQKAYMGGKFTQALRNGDLSPEGKKAIEQGIRFRLASMTVKAPKKDNETSSRNELPEQHKRFMVELANLGTRANAQAALAATKFVHDEIVKQAAELLTNSFHVRLHAVLIVGELDHAPASSLLLQVIQSKSITEDPIKGQPDAIKIAATLGLIRILRFANPAASVKDRTLITHAVVTELQKPDAHPWYQRRLVEGLRYTDISLDPDNQNRPFVVDVLMSVIGDAKRTWDVRAAACWALGRVPLPAGVDADKVVTSIASFSLSLAKAAAANPGNPHWKRCFWNAYLAFWPEDSKDMDAGSKSPGGLLAKIKPAAKPAYDLIVPIFRDVRENKAPSAADIQKLDAFTKARVPANNNQGAASTR